MSKKTLFLIANLVLMSFFAVLPPLKAATIVKVLDFTEPTIVRDRQTTAVMVEDLPVFANPGEPLLPAYGLRILLPQGEDVTTVDATVEGEREIAVGLPLGLARQELPTDSEPTEEAGMPAAAFDTARPFPAVRASHVYTGTYRGFNVAFISVHPVVYLDWKRSLLFAPRIEVRIETEPSAAMLGRSLSTLRDDRARDLSMLRGMVGDLDAQGSYAGAPFMRLGAGLADPGEIHPYVIITNVALEPIFELLGEHRSRRGLGAEIVLVSDIETKYSGSDLATKIREFIKDAYLNWQTEYVLLGGDDNVIPHRGLYAVGPSATDSDIASDLYYAALDGTWNDDGDAYWGEPAEADLMPELSVGRAAVGDSIEAANFVGKLIRYETSPVADQVKTGQMLGELLSVGTWGGDYKDEVRFGASTCGYTTAGFPEEFSVATLYDRDLQPDKWDKWDLIPLLNQGRHIINHIGHCNVTYGLRMYNADVETTLTNDGITSTYFVLYSQGCYSGSFDNRLVNGYTEDCIGEHFTFVDNGAVAFVGNTRYGWYMPYSTNGSSQHYDRQFFDALFGENITAIGRTNDDSRIDNIPLIGVGAMRWVYYNLVLLGDPAMDVWTGSPESLAVWHPDVIAVSDNEVEIRVEGGAAPVGGARVSIFTDSTYTTALADDGGVVYLNPVATGAGEVYLAVTAHNFYAYLDTIPVVAAGRPVLNIHELALDDDSLGVSQGNSNGKADAGEMLETAITLVNVGQDSAVGVTGVLRTSDPFVTVLDSSGFYGDVAPDSIVVPGWSFLYSVSTAAADGHEVPFEVELSCQDTSFTRHCSVVVAAPELEVVNISVGDTLYGNADGCVEPGEWFEIALTLANNGSGDGLGASAVLSEADPYVTLEADSAYADSILAGHEVEIGPPYLVAISEDCPEFHRIDLALSVTFSNGRAFLDTISVYVGGSLEDNIETGSPGWTHNDFDDIRADQWHLETYRNHTPGGGQAWKFGGSGSAAYASLGHGALVTPELCLGPSASLSFWHWIHAELNVGRYAWDGGVVEISTDGGDTWSQIAPSGGYYYKISSSFFSPFAGETPCFAWTGDWTHVTFDLSAFQGRASIRFRFGSDQYYADEGWYIDDVTVSDAYSSVSIPDKDLRPAPTAFGLGAIEPNPVASVFSVSFGVPRSCRISIRIFDVRGRVVATIADSVFQPGSYIRVFDGSALAPGAYFVSMRADAFGATRKMIVIR